MAVTGLPDLVRNAVTAPLVEAIEEAERLIAGADVVRTDQDLADGRDYLAGSVRACLHLAWTHSTTHPLFVTSTGPFTKMGLDNPDTLYRHAAVDPRATYRVWGRRGTTTDLSFQVLSGNHSATDVPGGDGAFDDRRLTLGPDGEFSCTFGPRGDDAAPDHFPLADDASMLAVREVYSDWTGERPGSIAIERVDTAGTAPPERTEEWVAKRYRVAARMLISRINTWFAFPRWFYYDEPVNTFTQPRLTPGGLSTQFSSVGHYDLRPDEAILVTVPKSVAPYQGFQLGNVWYTSLDYVHHQTSLTADQAQVDPDGMIRLLVSERNPGIANWIETTGRNRGILQVRWQRTDAPIRVADGPTAQVIDIGDVNDMHLPHLERNRIDDAGWRDRIRQRQRGFAERMPA